MTDKLREAAQQALEVLEELQGGCTDSDDGTVEVITVWCPEVIDTLRAALAQQDAQAVVLPEHETEAMHDAVMAVMYKGVTRINTNALWQAYRCAMLNAAPTPPARATLTASEILNMTPESIPAEHDGALLEYARDIIEAYKQKNGIK